MPYVSLEMHLYGLHAYFSLKNIEKKIYES